MLSATVNGSKMRQVREGKELTLDALAARCAKRLRKPVHRTTLNKIERGQRQPSAKLYGAIWRSLGCCDKDELLMPTTESKQSADAEDAA